MSSKLMKSKCNLPRSFHRSNFSKNCCTADVPYIDLEPVPEPIFSQGSLLSVLLRAACQVDRASGQRDAATQTKLSFSSPERKGRRRSRRKERKKKKKKEKRKKKYCSSPSYSDYEPDNPFLRLRNK